MSSGSRTAVKRSGASTSRSHARSCSRRSPATTASRSRARPDRPHTGGPSPRRRCRSSARAVDAARVLRSSRPKRGREHPNGLIALEADEEIEVMNAGGFGVDRPTEGGTTDPNFSPDWSPDGTELVFAGASEGYALYLMDTDGTGTVPLVDRTRRRGRPIVVARWGSDRIRLRRPRRDRLPIERRGGERRWQRMDGTRDAAEPQRVSANLVAGRTSHRVHRVQRERSPAVRDERRRHGALRDHRRAAECHPGTDVLDAGRAKDRVLGIGIRRRGAPVDATRRDRHPRIRRAVPALARYRRRPDARLVAGRSVDRVGGCPGVQVPDRD